MTSSIRPIRTVNRHQYIRGLSEEKILDIGAAEAAYFDETWNFDVVDIDETNKEKVIDRCGEWYKRDAHSLLFDSDSYETVLLCDILEHLVNPIQALREAYRVASDRVVITTPDEHRWDKEARPYSHGEHLRYYTGRTLRKQMKVADIPIEEIQIDHITDGPFKFWGVLIEKC